MNRQIHSASEDRRARILIADNGVRLLCQTQQPSKAEEDAGGFRCPERLCCEPVHTAYALRTLWRVFEEPLSQFYDQNLILARIAAALGFLQRVQHEDGSFDSYLRGEHRSPMQTAVIADVLCPVYAEITASGVAPTEFLNEFQTLLVACGQALLKYSLEAPEQKRRAIPALLRLDSLFPHPELTTRALRYLNDEKTENEGFIAQDALSALVLSEELLPLAQLTGNEAYYDQIRDNLKFLLHNLQENGEAVYQCIPQRDLVYSRDKSSGAAVWAAMAQHDRNGQFAAMADRNGDGRLTLADAARRNQTAVDDWKIIADPDDLLGLAVSDSRMAQLSRSGEILEINTDDLDTLPRVLLPTQYHRYYPEGRLVRARDDKKSVTLMGRQSNFLTLHNRGVVMEGLRLAANQNGWKPIIPKDFKGFDDYLYQFHAMEGALEWMVTVEIRAEAVSLVIEVDGPPRIPLQIEMAWRPEGLLETHDGRRYGLSHKHRTLLVDQDCIVHNWIDRITLRGLPSMLHRYYDDTQPWLPSVPIVRVLCPFFSPANLHLEFTLR